MTDPIRQVIAEQIVDALFTMSNGDKAWRIELKTMDDRGLGGWGREPAIRQVERVLTAALAAGPRPQAEAEDYVSLLKAAKEHVNTSVLYKRFISGTPLENDIAVWMADFASEHATLKRLQGAK
jgi:hypothetical protein